MLHIYCSFIVPDKEIFSHPTYSNVSYHKQEHLVTDILKLSYDAHNVLGHVTSPKKLCENANMSETLIQKHTMTFSSTLEVIQHNSKSRELRSTLQPLVSNTVLTDGMALKIASSGLCWDHLKLAQRRDGFESLKSLLGLKTQFGIRDGWMNQAYSRLSTTHGHITDCKL